MRRTVGVGVGVGAGVAVGVGVAVAVALAVAACGGSTTPVGDADGSAPAPTGLSPNPTVTGTSTTPTVPPASRDGGRPGRDGGLLDPDASPDPGSVQCNGVACDSATSYCCVERPPGTTRCVPQSTSSCGGLRRQCDEAADCPSGEQCLIPPNAALAIRLDTTCGVASPNDPVVHQVCKSSTECVNGQPCVAQTCQGEIVRTCGPIPARRCQ
jgi:hypothetical protein